MNRQQQKRRLRFARETLRTIAQKELGVVAGGAKATVYCAVEADTMPKSTAWTGGDQTDYIGCNY